MKTPTTTSQTPRRIAAGHYEISSDSREGVIYSLIYNHDRGIWECDCPDMRHNHNDNCKHRRKLIEHIRSEMSNFSKAQRQATAVVEHAISREVSEIEILRDDLRKMQQEMDRNAETIGVLRSQICRINELAANDDAKHQAEIADLQAQLDELKAAKPKRARQSTKAQKDAAAKALAAIEEEERAAALRIKSQVEALDEIAQEAVQEAIFAQTRKLESLVEDALNTIEETAAEAAATIERPTKGTLNGNNGFSMMR